MFPTNKFNWHIIADNTSEATNKDIIDIAQNVSIDYVSVGHGAGTFNLALDYALTLDDNDIVYFTDVPRKNADGKLDGSGLGDLAAIKPTERGENAVILKSVGTVDYTNGEIIVNTINITSTVAENNIIEVQAFPDSNDVVGLKDLYLSFDISNSEINMVRDVIASGEDISGVTFTRDYYTSSYSNGEIERK
jgi:hypothetical protein